MLLNFYMLSLDPAKNVKPFTTLKPWKMQSCFLSEEALSVSPLIRQFVCLAFLRNCKNSDNSGDFQKIHGQFATFYGVWPC